MAFCPKLPHFLVLTALFLLAVPSHQQGLPTCGRSTLSKIVGGSESAPNEFPWMVHLQLIFWSGDAATCGGTLISKDWVLTAAHCLYGAVSAILTLGAHDITSSSSSLSFNVSSRSFVTHPNFIYGVVENDIALIQLPSSVSPSANIQAACLPFANDPDQVNDIVVITGWGNFSNAAGSGLSPILRKMDSHVISSLGTNGKCQQSAGLGSFSGEKIICSDGSLQRHYCYGDDGGPMNFYNQEWDRWFVIGVAGTGDASIHCQNTNKPNVFNRVRGYLDWIEGVTSLKPITTTSTTTTTTTTTTRPPTTMDPSYFDCTNKPDGNYPNPASDCSTTFYMCSNGISFLFTCAQAGTVYRPEIYACDWPPSVAGCQ